MKHAPALSVTPAMVAATFLRTHSDKTLRRIWLWLALCLLGLSSPVQAHHSFQAEYDQSKPLTLVGKLTKVVNENPHGWIYLEVLNANGKAITWQLETPGPGVLNQNGFNRGVFENLVTSGEMVTVTAFAARDESKHAWAGGLTRADGRTVITLSGIPQQGPGGRGGQGRGQ